MAILSRNQSSQSNMVGSTSSMEQRHQSFASRSQAIVIMKQLEVPKEEEEFIDESISSYQDNAYDLATWRMYNRIVDYRMQHPISTNYYSSCDSATSTPQSLKQDGFCALSGMVQFTCQHPLEQLDTTSTVDQYDDEVFELDI
jgi:hypothetical protein